MAIYIRPSKTFFFSFLTEEIQAVGNGIGLDAACANMKNRHMFRTASYYGVDINLELIKTGLNKYQDPSTFGILADMSKLDPIPEGSVDLVVSSNTLYTIPAAQRIEAIQHLIRMTAPTGKLILEVPIADDFVAIQKSTNEYFEQVRIVHYQNFLSLAYEKIFERNGNLGSHPIAGSKPFLALSWLISRAEYLTRYFRSLNKHVVFVCTHKKSRIKNEFDLNNLPVLSDRIYVLPGVKATS